MTRLNEIHIDEGEGVLEELYERMTVRSGVSITLPNLKTLVIRNPADMLFPEDLAVSIRSRLVVCPLRKIVLKLIATTYTPLPSFSRGPFAALWRNSGPMGYELEVQDEHELNRQSLIDNSNGISATKKSATDTSATETLVTETDQSY